ncbi:PAN domain-containing protein At5g03700-like [Telopea speciosissima]|uniref:PAN domain-containing protein At5g03700-like n=1 Tax=Telopea speciosissima TaxID=54955 RepID=UPI001CC50417|nr:PAN domain-containing protein At5g03700-like [Telopea speciosissima]
MSTMGSTTESTARSLGFLLLPAFLLYVDHSWLSVGATTQELLIGFTATPDPPVSSFQPLLHNPNGTFSLGFLRNGSSQLALAIVHVPSSEPVWLANPTRWARWSKSTVLFFNGSLVLSDPHTGVLWSTHTDGERLLILNSGNLQIQKLDGSGSVVLWQSFDFPSDTLLENQNFTMNVSLVSSNGLYSMRLGDDFIGLYVEFKAGLDQIYWRHRALEAKASIVDGRPIYARVSPNGFLGMYQTEAAPVDVQSFNTFHRPISGIRRLRLESDGNLRGYYWYDSKWVSDFQAIDNECELPNACGSYGLCLPGGDCRCLDNRTEYSSGGCFPPESGDFCKVRGEDYASATEYWVLRRAGVELPYKELMGFEKMGSLEECESSCKSNCSCWGSVFHNVSGFCYALNYPISTLVSFGDASKIGYFKVRRIEEEKTRRGVRLADGIALLIGTVLIFVGIAGFGTYMWMRRKELEHDIFMEEQDLSHGSYRELLRSSSFGAVELCKR